MKKILLTMFAIMITMFAIVNVTNASALVRVDNDDEQIYELEGCDKDTIENFFIQNKNKKIELWIDSDSDTLKDLSDSINSMDNDQTYLVIYHNEMSEDNSYLYSKIKFLPIH